MNWKEFSESVKEYGSLAWSFLGILGILALLLALIATGIHADVKKRMKEHFRTVHKVECEH